jgi:hypothetical protein
MDAEMDANEEKMNDGQKEMRARVSAIQFKTVAMIKCSHEETEAAIHPVRSEFKDTIKHQV